MAMGKLADSMGRKRTAVFCALVMAAAMVWLTQSTSPWMLYLFAIVFGFVYGGLTPPLSALLGDIFGLRHFGSLIGARTAAWAIGFAFGPALAGYIFDIYASYDAAFLVGMAAMLITAVLVVLIKRPAARPR
jgi:MFS family permease